MGCNERLYKEVTLYETADGVRHMSEEKATEYATDKLCAEIEKMVLPVTSGKISTSEVRKIILALVGNIENVNRLEDRLYWWLDV